MVDRPMSIVPGVQFFQSTAIDDFRGPVSDCHRRSSKHSTRIRNFMYQIFSSFRSHDNRPSLFLMENRPSEVPLSFHTLAPAHCRNPINLTPSSPAPAAINVNSVQCAIRKSGLRSPGGRFQPPTGGFGVSPTLSPPKIEPVSGR